MEGGDFTITHPIKWSMLFIAVSMEAKRYWHVLGLGTDRSKGYVASNEQRSYCSGHCDLAMLLTSSSWPSSSSSLQMDLDVEHEYPSVLRLERCWHENGVARGRMVNRTSLKDSEQLDNRPPRSDGETKTQDKMRKIGIDIRERWCWCWCWCVRYGHEYGGKRSE